MAKFSICVTNFHLIVELISIQSKLGLHEGAPPGKLYSEPLVADE